MTQKELHAQIMTPADQSNPIDLENLTVLNMTVKHSMIM